MNPSTQRLRKLELCLIPDTAVAYLTALSHEERNKQFLSLTSYFKEYNSLIQSQQTDRQGTNRVTKALCVSGVLDSHTPFADTYSQQTKPRNQGVPVNKDVREISVQVTYHPDAMDKTADTYSPPFRGQDKQDRSRSNKPYRNDALDRSPVLSLDKIRNYQDGVVA